MQTLREDALLSWSDLCLPFLLCLTFRKCLDFACAHNLFSSTNSSLQFAVMADHTQMNSDQPENDRRNSLRSCTPKSPSEQIPTDATDESNNRSKAKTPPARRWQVGEIIEIPHLRPFKTDNDNIDESTTYRVNGNTICKIVLRPAIIFATYSTRMLALPILGGPSISEGDEKVVAIPVIYSDRDDGLSTDKTPKLIIKNTEAESWLPEVGAHVNLNQAIAVEYDWCSPIKNVLEPRSIKLLNTLTRFVYGMMMHMGIEEQNRELDAKIHEILDSPKRAQTYEDGSESEGEERKDRVSLSYFLPCSTTLCLFVSFYATICSPLHIITTSS